MIKIISLNANTTVNLINGKPDLSGFQEPTKSVLQSAFDDGSYEVIPDVVPQPFVPQIRVIDTRRLKIALFRLDHLSKVELLVAQAGKETQINWEDSTFVSEDFPLVRGIITSLKLTKPDVDEIFSLALSLE